MMPSPTDRTRAPQPSGAEARLPARVRAAIRAQEENSEILIGWVQFGIVALFATLYAVAPKAQDSFVRMFEPVPWVLGFYVLFTVLRLVLAYRRFLPTWFLYLSAATDMALLMGLIWSFHIQYGQPPAFYLKAPTLLYVFIFIALRALRFEPRFVLSTGIFAALGWLGLAGYALAVDSGRMMITRDYIAYVTGNVILIGAEVDKIVSILVVTAILTIALARARRLLVTAVRQGTAAQDLGRFFAPEIARAITDAEVAIAAGEGEARDAAILMIDIRGFTRHAATVEPDEVIRLLAGYQARMVPAIHRQGGSIDKFLGDGIMATFGAAQSVPDYAAAALRAVDAVMTAAAAWEAERAAAGLPALAVNAAVATGRVVFGAVGDADRLEYTVIGDAVNLAAKLEKHNKDEGVRALTTAETWRLALAQGYVPPAERERRAGRRAAGVAEPVDLVVVG